MLIVLWPASRRLLVSVPPVAPSSSCRAAYGTDMVRPFAQGFIPKMVLRFGVVIEGRNDAELPEQMFLSVDLNHFDPDMARAVDPVLASFLANPTNRVH